MTDATLPALSAADAQLLAARVLTAARKAPAGARWKDGRKVFVAELAGLLRAEGYATSDLATLKARLVELHRRGLVVLSRFDMPASAHHSRGAVLASETLDGGARYHCVEDVTRPW